MEFNLSFDLDADKYQVSGVPKIVINDKEELLGNQPLQAFLDAMETVRH